MKFKIFSSLLLSFPLLSTATEFNAKVDALFSEIDSNTMPGCSVGVIHQGKLIHKAGYGAANLELGVPLSGDNVHRIASVSKQFTAFSVLLLAEEGKIDLQKDIHTYIPDLPDYQHKVTVNAMLGHIAGMADYDFISGGPKKRDRGGPVEDGLNLTSVAGGPFRLGNEDYLTTEEFYEFVKKTPLRHAPNEKFDYSNLGYFLLAMLVEEVSGESLRKFADQRIFKPLGMNHTFFSDKATEIVKNRASGYKPDGNGSYVTDMTNLFWVGDGGVHTNVEDMAKWDQHFYQPKLGKHPKQLIQQFLTPNSDFEAFGGKYANGQLVSKFNNKASISHGGGWLGTTTFYERFPEEHFSTIVFCNDISQKAFGHGKKIAELFFEQE